MRLATLAIGSLLVSAASFTISYALYKSSPPTDGKGYLHTLALNFAHAHPMIDADVNGSEDGDGLEEVVIRTTRSKVILETSSDSKIRAAFKGKLAVSASTGNGQAGLSTKGIQFKRAGNKMRVELGEDANGLERSDSDFHLNFGNDGLNFDFEGSNSIEHVGLPKDFHGKLTIQTISGDITIPEFSLDQVSVETTSGDFQAAQLRAKELKITTVSGDVSVSGAIESTKLATTSGDVTLEYTGAVKAIHGATISGDVSVQFARKPDIEYSVHSVSGDVSVPEGWNGSNDDEPGRKHHRGVIGKGGAKVDFNTVSGDISLE